MALERLTDRELWRPCLEAVAAARAHVPAADTAVMVGSLSTGSYGTTGASGPGLSDARVDPSMLGVLAARMEPDERIAFRVSVAPDRSGEVLLVDVTLPQLAGASPMGDISGVVFDPTALPEPYRRRPVSIDRPRSPHADPDTVRRIIRAARPDADPASAAAIAVAEQSLGFPLPDDVIAMYETARSGYLLLRPGGIPTSHEEIDFESDEELHEMVIVDLGIPERSACTATARAYAWPHVAAEVVMPDRKQRVQALGHSSAWFLIGADTYGGYYVTDLAPGPRGTYGQILHVTREGAMGAQWVAPSLTEFLLEGEHPDADPYFADVAPPTSVRIGDHTDQTMSDVSEDTEVLHINAVSSPVDLAPLAGHPRLRSLLCTTDKLVGIRHVLAMLPQLEYPELPYGMWISLASAGAVPSGLAAAGFSDAPGDLVSPIALANALLADRGLGTIPVTRIRSGGTVDEFTPR